MPALLWEDQSADERYAVETRVDHYGDNEFTVATCQSQGNASELRDKDTPQQRGIFYQQDCMSAGISAGHLTDISLRMAHERAAEVTRDSIDGCTATTAAVTDTGLLHVANIADSPTCLFVIDESGNVRSHYLIHDEHDAPRDAGGKIEKIHVLPDYQLPYIEKVHYPISISRNLGGAPYGLPKTPDIQSFDLASLVRPGERIFLCVASDGITPPDKGKKNTIEWLQHYAGILQSVLRDAPEASVAQMAEAITKEAVRFRRMDRPQENDIGEQDNITLMLAEIPGKRQHDFHMTICDGHRAATLDGSDNMPGICAQQSVQIIAHNLSKPGLGITAQATYGHSKNSSRF